MHAHPDADPLLPASQCLRSIVELSALLGSQAKHRASDPEMPGGTAMAMLGAVANPIIWRNRTETIERLWWESEDTTEAERPNLWRDEDGWEPPLQTLMFWSSEWRNEWDRPNDAPTVVSETKFLASILQWAYDHEVHWDDFVRDLRRAVSQMEALLRAGERDERSGVPCIDCVMDRNGEKISVNLIRPVGDQGRDDAWTCPKCRRRYDLSAFIRARHSHLASNGAERFVPLAEAVAVIPRPESTVRKWLFKAHIERGRMDGEGRLVTRGSVRWMCDLQTRRLLVWWPDMRLRDAQSAPASEMTTM